jgi:chromosome partitioning protein
LEGDCKVIVTVGNTKGGVGKTTLAFQLALARAVAGRDVLLVDADRQGSAQTAVAVRAEAGHSPGLACSCYPDGAMLRTQVKRQAGKYEDVVIDAGGRDSTALRAALMLSDVLLVPYAPRTVDVWALGDIAALVDEARAMRDGLRVLAVLNLADAGASRDNADALAALADFPQLTAAPALVCRRKAFANAVGFGLALDELTPRDAKASEELAALAGIVFADQHAV